MKTLKDITSGPMREFLDKHDEYWRNKQKNVIPSNLRTYEDLMAEVEDVRRTSLDDQHLVLKLKEKGYNVSQKGARGVVGYFDCIKGSLYRIQITDRDERGNYPIAWVIDIELQKIYEH